MAHAARAVMAGAAMAARAGTGATRASGPAAAAMEGASELEGMAMDGMWPNASVGTGGDVFPHVTGFLLLRIR